MRCYTSLRLSLSDLSLICRVPRKTKGADPLASPLPEELRQPLAVAVRLLALKVEPLALDELEFPDPKSPGAVTPVNEEGARSPTVGSRKGSTSLVSRCSPFAVILS